VTVISGDDGFHVDDITITGSTVDITSVGGIGINADGVEIDDSTVIIDNNIANHNEGIAAYNGGDVLITNGSVVEIYCGCDGIYTTSGDITINNSRLTVVNDCYGINSSESIYIEADSVLDISAPDYGLYASGNIELNGGYGTIESTGGDKAVYASGTLTAAVPVWGWDGSAYTLDAWKSETRSRLQA